MKQQLNLTEAELRSEMKSYNQFLVLTTYGMEMGYSRKQAHEIINNGWAVAIIGVSGRYVQKHTLLAFSVNQEQFENIYMLCYLLSRISEIEISVAGDGDKQAIAEGIADKLDEFNEFFARYPMVKSSGKIGMLRMLLEGISEAAVEWGDNAVLSLCKVTREFITLSYKHWSRRMRQSSDTSH
jgi:hypothetical protein